MGKSGEGQLFSAVVEEDKAQRVPGILCANEMRERHGHALRGRESVFAVKNHAMAAIEKHDGCAGALVFALMNHQIGIVQFDRYFCALASHGIEERLAHVEVQGIAKLVRA